MFKDYNKYLSASLKVYLFVLIIIFIMKMIGLDYFGIDYENYIIKFLDKTLNIPIINNIIQFAMLSFQLYLIGYIGMKTKPKIYKVLIATLINLIATYLLFKYNLSDFYSVVSSSIIVIFLLTNKVKFLRTMKVLGIMAILEAISGITRNNSITEYSFTISIILSLDYMIMLLIGYKLTKEDVKTCQHHGYSSQKKLNLKQLLKRLQENLHNFKHQDKQTKLTIIIYTILSIFWNLFTIFTVLLFAKLNNTLIECIFIMTSFWLTKRAFGKAFHLPSMLKCFIVSNLSYYILNRITTPLGISIFIPIMLGVGLSYITSKLVKKTYKPLYRGMPEELFEETILKVVDKDSDKYKICYEYFIEKKSAVALSMKYNYTESGIKKLKDRVNNKIKELK